MVDLFSSCTTADLTCDRTTSDCKGHSKQKFDTACTLRDDTSKLNLIIISLSFTVIEIELPFTKFHPTLFIEAVTVLNGRLDQSVIVRIGLILETLPVAFNKTIKMARF